MTIPHVKCDICNIILNSQVTYEQHISGSKHKKKASMAPQETGSVEKPKPLSETSNKNYLKCEKCGVNSMNEASYQLHISGKKHKRNENDQNIGPSECLSQFNCDICNLSLASKDQLDAHLIGKKHLKKLNAKPKPVTTVETESFSCELCGLVLVSKDQLDIHLSGKKHLKKLTSLSKVAQLAVQSKPKVEDEKKFENLNIAWDKYKINDQLKLETENKYEYFCTLCNKYIQRKLQLVDHLKSKKHHRRIHESRNIGKSQNQLKSQNVIKPSGFKTSQSKYQKKIDFVPSSQNNYNNVKTNTFYQAQSTSYPLYYQNQNTMQPNYNTKRKIEQSNQGNNTVKKFATESSFNPSMYGYGYDQTSNSNDLGNFYWKTPMSQSEMANRQMPQYNTESYGYNQNGQTTPGQFANFAFNVLSSMNGLQYQGQQQPQNFQQNNSNF